MCKQINQSEIHRGFFTSAVYNKQIPLLKMKIRPLMLPRKNQHEDTRSTHWPLRFNNAFYTAAIITQVAMCMF